LPPPKEEEEDKAEESSEPKKVKQTVWDWEIINANKPIWTRAAKDVEKEECVHSAPQQPNTATSHSLHPLPIQRQIYGPHCL